MLNFKDRFDFVVILSGFVTLITGALPCERALAEDKIILNAFGTIGYAVMVNSKGGEEFSADTYNYVPRKTRSYWGIRKTGTFDRDTRFGLNLSAPITKGVYLTAQIYAESANQTTGVPEYFDAKFAVMSLTFSPYRDVQVRLGLFQVPLWFISEEKYVGYTYPYIRNPLEVQGITFVGDTMRGLSLAYNYSLGKLIVKPRVTFGSYVHDNPATPQVALPTDANIILNNVTLEYENVLFNAGYHYFKGQTDQLITRNVNQNGIDIRATLPSSLYYTGTNLALGMKGEFKRIMFIAEYNSHESDWKSFTGFLRPLQGSIQKITGAYGLIGFPMGPWLPHTHYAWFKKTVDAPADALDSFIDIFVNKNPDIPAAMKPIARQGIRAKGHTLLSDLYETNTQQQTFNIGLNYQWSINTVVKLEAERVSAPGNVSGGQFGLKRGSTVDTVSTAVDFVY